MMIVCYITLVLLANGMVEAKSQISVNASLVFCQSKGVSTAPSAGTLNGLPCNVFASSTDIYSYINSSTTCQGNVGWQVDNFTSISMWICTKKTSCSCTNKSQGFDGDANLTDSCDDNQTADGNQTAGNNSNGNGNGNGRCNTKKPDKDDGNGNGNGGSGNDVPISTYEGAGSAAAVVILGSVAGAAIVLHKRRTAKSRKSGGSLNATGATIDLESINSDSKSLTALSRMRRSIPDHMQPVSDPLNASGSKSLSTLVADIKNNPLTIIGENSPLR
jgi:hypothetical protein